MASLKISSAKQSGFTLTEILIVITMIVMILGFSLFISLDAYRSSSFHDERNIIISILMKARSQSVTNLCLGSACTGGEPHGVHFEADRYVIFQGTSYSSSDPFNEVIPSGKNDLTFTGPTDVVFEQLSGSVSGGPWVLTISDSANHTSAISINSEGQITWTN